MDEQKDHVVAKVMEISCHAVSFDHGTTGG